MKRILFLLFIALGLFACNPDLDRYGPTAGDADFSSYVAIGNSLTSGYANSGLSLSGQEMSFPLMLSEQFALAGGGAFKVPFMNAGVGNDGGGNPPLTLGYGQNCLGATSLGPVLAGQPGGGTAFHNVSANGPFNNIGVPGIRAVDITFGLYSGLNPYMQRFVQTPGASTVLSEALRANPTFFSIWMGNNDALGWATGGGVGAVGPGTPFPGDLSNPAQVIGSIGLLVDSLVGRGAKGVLATIPDVTSIPYFTTVPYNAITLDAATAAQLNAVYSQAGLTNITWQEGANPAVIVDSSVSHPVFKIRQATANDLMTLTLPSDSIRCANWGSDPTKPIPDQYVLDVTEVATVQSYIAQYNSGIAQIATQYDLALADMNDYFKTFKSGIVYNGVDMSAEFITGGSFSLDGVHPNPRGYAIVANRFLEAINAKYGSRIPDVDPLDYPGIIFPN